MAKLLAPKELAELVSGLLIQPELMGELENRQTHHDFILAIGNVVAQFCGGDTIGIEYHPPLTHQDASYTPMLVVNPNESLPSLLGSVWSFFDPRGWDDLPLPSGIERGQEPSPEHIQTVRSTIQRMVCPFACNPIEQGLDPSLSNIPPRRIHACVQAFEGVDLERFEGKTIGEYIANQTRLLSAGPGESGGLDVLLDGGACRLVIEAFAGQFKQSGATNYFEIGFTHDELGPFTVTIQRVHGITPSQRIDELQRRVERYEEELASVTADRDTLKAKFAEYEQQDPLIEAVFTASGAIIHWKWYSAAEGSDEIDLIARKYGKPITRLYAPPPSLTQPLKLEPLQALQQIHNLVGEITPNDEDAANSDVSPSEYKNECNLKTITDFQVMQVVRAFWRRIEPFKNLYGRDLPRELPVEFMAHMATALTFVDLPAYDDIDLPQVVDAKPPFLLNLAASICLAYSKKETANGEIKNGLAALVASKLKELSLELEVEKKEPFIWAWQHQNGQLAGSLFGSKDEALSAWSSVSPGAPIALYTALALTHFAKRTGELSVVLSDPCHQTVPVEGISAQNSDLTLIGHWNSAGAQVIRCLDGILRGSFPDGTPIYAASQELIP